MISLPDLPSSTATRLPILVLAVGLLVALVVSATRRKSFKRCPLPPGPTGYPIIGNALDLPKTHEWLTYTSWKTYGDLVYLSVMGKDMIIVQSLKAARDLYEGRSNKYSGRARMPMVVELMGWDWNFGSLSYGEKFKEHRKLFFSYFSPSSIHQYYPTLEQEAMSLARALSMNQNDIGHQIRHMAARVIMMIAYGHEVAAGEDEYVSRVEQAVASLSEALNPGSFLVDFFPTLKYVPSWFPFAGFKKKAAAWKQLAQEAIARPFEMVQRNMAIGKAPPCLVSTLLEQAPSKGIKLETIRNCAATTYTSGSDTTVSAIHSFVLAMVLHPEVQRKAQHELDIVLDGRLPTFADRKSLPYLDAILEEVLRWNPVTPLGIAHTSTEDDVYDGYYIPKGTLLLPNQWAMLHDPLEYGPDPMAFRPERFLGEKRQRDPRCAAFGFGARLCPGRFLADAELWITFATLLATLSIRRAVDVEGNEIIPSGEYNSGFLSHPLPFQANITVRNSKASEDMTTLLDLPGAVI